MKKGSLTKYIAILLFITMLTLIVIANTYAKYTSEFSGTGTATAADWKVTVNGETPGATNFTLTAENKIYPGAENISLGNVTVANTSSTVSAKVTSILVEIKDSTLKDSITLSIGDSDQVIAPGASIEVPVVASWEYKDVDETSYADTNIEFDITLTVDQVVVTE